MILVDDYDKYKPQIISFLAEHVSPTCVPYAIRRIDYHDYEAFVQGLIDDQNPTTCEWMPSITYFGYLADQDLIVGAINCRLKLNDFLLNEGGHIGIGVRQSYRGYGYGTKMIKLAVAKLKELGVSPVLMTTNVDNIASIRSIANAGGVLEDIRLCKKGMPIKRYWLW